MNPENALFSIFIMYFTFQWFEKLRLKVPTRIVESPPPLRIGCVLHFWGGERKGMTQYFLNKERGIGKCLGREYIN